MGFKIKNSLTGEFEKLPILTLKGEKGETGGVEEYNKVDYMGNKYETLKQANDANVEYAVKTAIGEFNYLDYEGQNITTTNSIEGHAKSAILSGQTLVNVIRSKREANSMFTDYNLSFIDKTKTYFIKFNSSCIINQIGILVDSSSWNVVNRNVTLTNGYITLKPDESLEVFGLRIRYDGQIDDGSIPTIDVICVEYQDGMEKWNIPYFEGMQSVKMPVLTTTGKNLFDLSKAQLGYVNSSGIINSAGKNNFYSDYISIKPNTDYTFFKVGGHQTTLTFSYYDKNKNFISFNATNNYSTSPSNAKFLIVHTQWVESGTVDFNDVKLMIVEGRVKPTTYEPYKTNILTTSEEVVLRGIGEVRDELNVSPGELTRRIKEIVFDGSDDEAWSFGEMKGDNYKFGLSLKTDVYGSEDRTPILSDKFAAGNLQTELTQEQVMIYNHTNYMELRLTISPNKLTSNTGQALKDYLKANPFTIQYALGTPAVKTVDLSDNHIYSYQETTHYDCSSAEGSLVPTLSVKVPTDVQATIAQQRETIQTLNSENERLNQIQEALKASMLDSQVQLMNLSWNTDFEVFTLRESIATKDSLMDSRTGSNIDKFSQAKFIIENDCPDLEKLNSQIEYYFSKDVFSQEQFEELTDLISIVKGENGCEY